MDEYREMLYQHFDAQLQALQQKMARQEKLKSILAELHARRNELQESAVQLDYICKKEKYDVNRLEGLSLAGLFLLIAGKREETLDRERAEAQAARAQYEACIAELERLRQDIPGYEEELAALSGCEQEYERLLAEKGAAMRAGSDPVGRQLLEMEKRLAWLELQQREITQAQTAGTRVLDITHDIIAYLEFARRMHCRDPLFRGSYHQTQMRSAMKSAQQCAHRLPAELQAFRNELMDLQLQFHAEAGEFNPPQLIGYISIGGMIVYSKTLDFINAALEHLRAITGEAAEIRKNLEDFAIQVKNEQAVLAKERIALIERA